MPERAMIVVGGGTSSRFGSDKLIVEVAGRPLISHTLDAVSPAADACVLVCAGQVAEVVAELHPEVITAPPGSSRTLSEMSGLGALRRQPDLIGIHDAARPAVPPDLVRRLYDVAAFVGGAVPVIRDDEILLDRRTHRPVQGLQRAQTPQVFRGPELLAGYVRAAEAGFEGHDTAEVVQRFTDLEIAAVPGDPRNLKVTYPSDLSMLAEALKGPSRT